MKVRYSLIVMNRNEFTLHGKLSLKGETTPLREVYELLVGLVHLYAITDYCIKELLIK